MKAEKTIHLLQKENIHRKKDETEKEFEYRKAKFLLGFEGDPVAQEDGLKLLKK